MTQQQAQSLQNQLDLQLLDVEKATRAVLATVQDVENKLSCGKNSSLDPRCLRYLHDNYANDFSILNSYLGAVCHAITGIQDKMDREHWDKPWNWMHQEFHYFLKDHTKYVWFVVQDAQECLARIPGYATTLWKFLENISETAKHVLKRMKHLQPIISKDEFLAIKIHFQNLLKTHQQIQQMLGAHHV